jgi:hypothetical protein
MLVNKRQVIKAKVISSLSVFFGSSPAHRLKTRWLPVEAQLVLGGEPEVRINNRCTACEIATLLRARGGPGGPPVAPPNIKRSYKTYIYSLAAARTFLCTLTHNNTHRSREYKKRAREMHPKESYRQQRERDAAANLHWGRCWWKKTPPRARPHIFSSLYSSVIRKIKYSCARSQALIF